MKADVDCVSPQKQDRRTRNLHVCAWKKESWVETFTVAHFHIVYIVFYSVSAINTSMYTDFPGGAVVKNPPANAGDTGSSPGLGRSHMLWSN